MIELRAKLTQELGLSDDQATAILEAAEPLWDALERLGWVDSYGGAECCRVLPAALSLIHRGANQGPVPVEWN